MSSPVEKELIFKSDESLDIAPNAELLFENKKEEADLKSYFHAFYWGDLPDHQYLARYGSKKDTGSVDSDPDFFIDSLLDFIVEKEAETDPRAKELLTDFLENVRETYFSSSTDIFSRCKIENLLRLGAKVNRIPIVQGYFGQAIVGAITQTLVFGDSESFKKIKTSLEDVSLAEELDIITFLQTVAADVIANGSWASEGLGRIRELYQNIKDKSTSSFLDYAIALSNERISKERQQPTLGIVTFQGNRENGRLSEGLNERQEQESDRLAHSIRSSIPLERGDKYVQISQDTLAIVDRTNNPVYYGRISPKELEVHSSPVDIRAIERVKESTAQLKGSPIKLSRFIEYLNLNLIVPLSKGGRDMARVWHENIGLLEEAEWGGFFEFRKKINSGKENILLYEEEKRREAGDKNAEAFKVLANKLHLTLAGLIQAGQTPPLGWEELDKFVATGQDDEEGCFDAVEKIFKPFSLGVSLPGIYSQPELIALAADWRELDNIQILNFKEAEAAIENRYTEAEAEYYEVIGHYNVLAARLINQLPEFQNQVTKFTERLQEQYADILPEVSFSPYAELSLDKKVNPFPGQQTSDLPFLMQQLHRPLMREKIEQDLGISFREFKLNSQVHLLQFLAGNNQEIFGRMRALLQTDPSYKKEFLISFLSCAGDYAFGEKLIAIAERFSPETAAKVFSKYAELVEASESTREYLQSNYTEELAEKPGREEEIVQGLLRRGRQILAYAATEGAEEGEIVAELDKSKGDMLLFANAFKGMYGREASLEKFKELSLNHVKGGDLSPKEYDQMLVMADKNWEGLRALMPEMYAQIMHDVPAQLKGLDPKTGDPIDTNWHLMKRGETVLGYFRLDTTSADTVYFGSMNSLSDLHGFKLGDAILREMLTKETEGKLTKAHASPKTAICRSYINKYGFVGIGLLPYYETGEDLLAIEKDARLGEREKYKLQGKNFAELEKLKGGEEVEVLEYSFTDTFKDEAYKEFLKDAQLKFDQGFVLSAYVADTTEYLTDPATNTKKVRYLAGFEPKIK